MKIVLRVAGYVLCEDECGSEDCVTCEVLGEDEFGVCGLAGGSFFYARIIDVYFNIIVIYGMYIDMNYYSCNGVVMGLMDGFLRRTLFPVRFVVEDGGGELLGNDERNVIKSLLNCE